MSMQEIRHKLAKEELLRSGEGEELEREDTPSTFLIMGMEIEESQCIAFLLGAGGRNLM
jgi:hypothetical protein